MGKTIIIYNPEGGSVEKSAKLVNKYIDGSDITSLKHFKFEMLNEYDNFIFGCSTVGADSWQAAYTGEQWVPMFKKAQDDGYTFKGKKVALFGLGNSILYPNHFIDHVEILHKEAKNMEAEMIGYTSTEGYDYFDSAAVINEKFMGLALDEDNESELTEKRVKNWIDKIITEL